MVAKTILTQRGAHTPELKAKVAFGSLTENCARSES